MNLGVKLIPLITASSVPFLLFFTNKGLGEVNVSDSRAGASQLSIRDAVQLTPLEPKKEVNKDLPKPKVDTQAPVLEKIDNNILINKEGWTVSFDKDKCKLVEKKDYSLSTEFVVSCEDVSLGKTKKLSAIVRVVDNSQRVEFWLELDKTLQTFFHNSHISSPEEIKSLVPQGCLFTSANSKSSHCLLSWEYFVRLSSMAEGGALWD